MAENNTEEEVLEEISDGEARSGLGLVDKIKSLPAILANLSNKTLIIIVTVLGVIIITISSYILFTPKFPPIDKAVPTSKDTAEVAPDDTETVINDTSTSEAAPSEKANAPFISRMEQISAGLVGTDESDKISETDLTEDNMLITDSSTAITTPDVSEAEQVVAEPDLKAQLLEELPTVDELANEVLQLRQRLASLERENLRVINQTIEMEGEIRLKDKIIRAQDVANTKGPKVYIKRNATSGGVEVPEPAWGEFSPLHDGP